MKKAIKKQLNLLKNRMIGLEKEVQALQINKINVSDLTEKLKEAFEHMENYSSK